MLVGQAPRLRPRVAQCPLSQADGWTDQVPNTLALLAAIITLAAAIWWTASAPLL